MGYILVHFYVFHDDLLGVSMRRITTRIQIMKKASFVLVLFGMFFVLFLFTFARTKFKRSDSNNDIRGNAASQDKPTDPIADFQISKNVRVDCASNKSCQEVVVNGDEHFRLPNGGESPFAGFADPSIRKDRNGLLWMSYSWPHLKFQDGKPTPSVDIHLAKSADQGKNWQFIKKLFTATNINNPAKQNQKGYLDYEVVNLLPVTNGSNTIWYGVTLNYFVPEKGGMAARPSDSFHIRVYKANNPEEITNTEHAILAGGTTAKEWSPSQRLVPREISETDKKSFFWNEPSLYFENGKLYLVMVAFNLKNRADITRDAVYVYSTNPDGDPESWKWTYNGKLAGLEEAKLLSSERLTQIDVARSDSGKLLLIATPDDWNDEYKDYNHKGCVALEIVSLEKPELRRTVSGKLAVHAKIEDSQANKLGSAACSYDPGYSGGILFTRRNKTASELTAEIWATGVRP